MPFPMISTEAGCEGSSLRRHDDPLSVLLYRRTPLWRKDVVISETEGTVFLAWFQKFPGCCGDSTRQLDCIERHLEKSNGGSSFIVGKGSMFSYTQQTPILSNLSPVCSLFTENRRDVAIVRNILYNLEVS